VPPLRPLRQFQVIAILMANWYEQQAVVNADCSTGQ
jgi:hypothetical protein